MQQQPVLADRNRTFDEQAAAGCHVLAATAEAIATRLGPANQYAASFERWARSLDEAADRLECPDLGDRPGLRLVD